LRATKREENLLRHAVVTAAGGMEREIAGSMQKPRRTDLQSGEKT
jgi:hypothetical protein